MKGPVFAPQLISAADAGPGVRLFRFKSPEGFKFTPGQFLMFHFEDDPKTWRAYSLCSSPRRTEWFEIAVGMAGPFSDRLGRLEKGHEKGLAARGPFGKWIYDGSAPHAVLVSGGSGITPFRAMCLLKADGGAPGKLSLCYSARTPDDLLFKDEYDSWRRAGVDLHLRVTRMDLSRAAWAGDRDRWTAENVLRASGNDPNAVYYICGPNKMVAELREALERRVPPARVRTEKWGDYADLI